MLRVRLASAGVLSSWLRVRPDLYALGNWRIETRLCSANHSSLLFPRKLMDEFGEWDRVRAGADNELLWRIRTKMGDDAVIEAIRDVPLSFSLVRPDALTRQSATHVKTVYHGIRKDYRRSYRRWQRKVTGEGDLAIGLGGQKARRFPAPKLILPAAERLQSFDRIYIADFGGQSRNSGLYSRLVAQDCAKKQDHETIGIFHWHDYESAADYEFHPVIGDVLDQLLADQISAYQTAKSGRLILCDPLLARFPIDGLPQFQATHLDALCPEPAAHETVLDPRRRSMPSLFELEQLFGIPCYWRVMPPENEEELAV